MSILILVLEDEDYRMKYLCENFATELASGEVQIDHVDSIPFFERKTSWQHTAAVMPVVATPDEPPQDYDILVLDHDLGRGNGDGQQACDAIPEDFDGKILIWSYNAPGAKAMQKILKRKDLDSDYSPFGPPSIKVLKDWIEELK